MPAKKQANGTRFSAGTQPPSASPTADSGPGAALISDHDMAVRSLQLLWDGHTDVLGPVRARRQPHSSCKLVDPVYHTTGR